MSYEFIEVGNTRKAIGFDGSIRLEIEDVFLQDLVKAEAIFIMGGFEILPYFPSSLKDDGGIIARFDDIQDREAATLLAGKPVYLRKIDVSAKLEQREALDTDALIGAQLIDETIGEVGEILALESYPQQQMLIVSHNEKEVMIPLHMDLVVEFREGETLLMNLPEGLLDI